MLYPCSFLFHGNNTTGYTKSRLVDALPYVSDYVCYSPACVDTITKSRFRAAGLHIFYFAVTNAILCWWYAEHLGKERWHSLVTLCIIHSSINMLKSIWNNFTRSCNHFSPTSSMYINHWIFGASYLRCDSCVQFQLKMLDWEIVSGSNIKCLQMRIDWNPDTINSFL